MPSDLTLLPALVGREVRAVCGCAVVACAPRLIDRDGTYVIGHANVIVPCENHREVAAEVAASVRLDDLDGIAEALEEAITSWAIPGS